MILLLRGLFLLAAIFQVGRAHSEPFTDPCDTLDVIPFSFNRSTGYKLNANDDQICDDEIDVKWYRMEWYDMPTEPPTLYSCGSRYPVWLNATIPNEGETEHNLTTCAVTEEDPCYAGVGISVKNCGLYRVYGLYEFPMCGASFCFDPVDNRATAPVFDQDVRVELNDALEGDTDLVFRCEFDNVDKNMFYTYHWYQEDQLIKKKLSLTEGNLADHYLHQDEITELDVNIRCAVEASASPTGHLSPLRESNNLFIGIVVLTPKLIISRTDPEPVVLKLRPSVPIRCCNLCSMIEMVCPFRIAQETTFGSDVCPNWDVKFNHRCGYSGAAAQWNSTIEFKITISSPVGNNVASMGRILRLMIFPDKTINSLWHNYTLPNVWVQYGAGSTVWMNTECHANIDPHMSTFDRLLYELQVQGDFIFYRHTNLPLEVQIRTKSCYGNSGSPYCVTDVAVRAGRDVFLLSLSQSPPFVGMLSCGDELLEIREMRTDLSYKIYLPTGTTVNPYVYGKNMNVNIIPSPRDIGSTEGLCGVLSGDRNDDLCYRDGSGCDSAYTRHPSNFYNSWRVQKSESLFDAESYIMKNLPQWDENVTICTCKFNEREENLSKSDNIADCSKKSYNVCNLNALNNQRKREFKCTIKNTKDVSRRRREVVRRMKRSAEHRFKRSDENTSSNDSQKAWTEEEADEFCRSYMNSSTKYNECVQVAEIDTVGSLAECSADIMLTNSTEWAIAAKEAVMKTCVNQIQMNNTVVVIDENGTYSENDTVVYTPIYDIENSICPYDCNGHGTCDNGTCICDEDFGFGDCSVNITAPPPTQDIYNNGLCDTSETECDEVSLYGEDYLDSEDLSCRVVAFEINSTGGRNEGQTHTVVGEYISRYEVSCPVPPVGNETNAPFVPAYKISISNTGDLFGDELDLFVYNSDCVTETDKSFSINDKCCYIERQYYSIEDINEKNNSQICDPARSTFAWSDKLVCSPWQYGFNCQQPCQCIKNNTVGCDEDTGVCECKQGWNSSTCEKDIDECLADPCPSDANCTDYDGFYNCSCGIGKYIQNQTCVECEDNYYGQDCQSECQCVDTNTKSCSKDDGNCTCNSGWEGAACDEDIVECTSNPCQGNATCTDADGSYTCTCNAGYVTDNEQCIECAAGKYGTDCNETCECDMDHTTTCDNVDGQCTCQAGWNGTLCDIDINECEALSCQANADCKNNNGSYTCECKKGHKLTGVDCTECEPDKYGTNCSETCQCTMDHTVACDNVDGQCTCQAGWNGTLCDSDINECKTVSCQANADCKNNNGSYTCECKMGHKLTGGDCLECEPDKYGTNCSETCQCSMKHTETCDKVHGHCTCSEGWTGTLCEEDINECDNSPCPNNSTCENTDGSYTCTCNDGFKMANSICQECEPGKYGTSCGETCKCAMDHTVTCDKVDGNCTCQKGWNGTLCKNHIDYCSSVSCQDNAVCENTDGSYRCNCNEGYKLRKERCVGYRPFDITMKLDVNEPDWSNKEHMYQAVLKKAADSLTQFYTRTSADDFLGLEITGVSRGSLNIDHIVYWRKGDLAASEVKAAIATALEEPKAILYDAENVGIISVSTVNDKKEKVTLTRDDLDTCNMFTALEQCPEREACQKSVDGSFECVPDRVEDELGLTALVLVIVIPVVFAVVIIFLFIFKFARPRTAGVDGRREPRMPVHRDDYFPNIKPMRHDVDSFRGSFGGFRGSFGGFRDSFSGYDNKPYRSRRTSNGHEEYLYRGSEYSGSYAADNPDNFNGMRSFRSDRSRSQYTC